MRPPAALGRFIASVDPFAMARDGLSAETYAAAYAVGERMSLEEAVALIRDIGATVAAGTPIPQ